MAKQGPVPTHVLAVSSRLAPGVRQQLRKAVLDFSETNTALRDAVFTSKLVEADGETHLAPVVKALELMQAK